MTVNLQVHERYEVSLSGDDLGEILNTAGNLVRDRRHIGDQVVKAYFSGESHTHQQLHLTFQRRVNSNQEGC